MICDKLQGQVGGGSTQVGRVLTQVDYAMPDINVRCVQGVTRMGEVARVAGGGSGEPRQVP